MSLIQHLHPATVHFPIALLLLASIAGLLFLFWQPRAELRVLGWWPMLIGWAGTAVAIATGLIAQSGLPPDAPYRSTLNLHIGSGLALLIVYGTPLYLKWRRRASGDPLDDPGARSWLAVLLLLGMLLLLLTGWNGGQLVYRWAVNVGL